VAQKGSLVAPDRLRFDFSHFQPLTRRRSARSRTWSTRGCWQLPAETEVLAIADAKKAGAIAFFGEKYGDTVRVLTMGESKEFCGGTHVARTGDIGLFKITEETGIAQGVRRLEAVTGEGAVAYVRRLEQELGTRPRSCARRRSRWRARRASSSELRERDKEIAKLKAQIASGGGGAAGRRPSRSASTGCWCATWAWAIPRCCARPPTSCGQAGPGHPGAGRRGEGKVALVCAVTPGAGPLRRRADREDAGQELGWKGGGRKDLAQGGGRCPRAGAGGVLEGWRKKVHEQVGGAA
jgi:alanyl-tRNA synthetase